MSKADPRELAEKIENTLKSIKDIVATRIVMNANNEIDEVHVLARPSRSVKNIVKDIESSLIAAFGIQIDRRKISIAKIDNGEPFKDDQDRLIIQKVEFISEGNNVQTQVSLKLGDSQAIGRAEGRPTPKEWLRLAAKATIGALVQFLPSKVTVLLEDVTVTQGRSSRIALVSLIIGGKWGEQVLSGSCPVTFDDREAVIKATLDAVNRKFAVLRKSD